MKEKPRGLGIGFSGTFTSHSFQRRDKKVERGINNITAGVVGGTMSTMSMPFYAYQKR